jgi:hypothetical protein
VWATVISRSAKRLPRSLCVPNERLRHSTNARSSRSAWLLVGSTPSCSAKVHSAGWCARLVAHDLTSRNLGSAARRARPHSPAEPSMTKWAWSACRPCSRASSRTRARITEQLTTDRTGRPSRSENDTNVAGDVTNLPSLQAQKVNAVARSRPRFLPGAVRLQCRLATAGASKTVAIAVAITHSDTTRRPQARAVGVFQRPRGLLHGLVHGRDGFGRALRRRSDRQRI